MVIKPFSHLARQSFAKTLAHGYAQSVVAASQSSYASTTTSLGQFQHYPVHKFSRTTQLQNVFQTASNSSGPGAKAGHASHGSSTNADGGLAAYYAAWQHAQQTGDDSDWRQHQFSKKIGWKTNNRKTEIKRRHRHDSSLTPDSLRPIRTSSDRAFSETDLHHFKASPEVEAEALDRVNEAIAQEIQSVKEANIVDSAHEPSSTVAVPSDAATDAAVEAVQAEEQISEEGQITPSSEGLTSSHDTKLTSPTVEAYSSSNQIVQLARSGQYARIPAVFEHMLKDGVVPTVEAYNAILVSAIYLTKSTYQVLPKALEVYGDMVRRSVTPNEDTHIILIDFLAAQARDAHAAKSSLEKRRIRFGNGRGGFLLKSSELEYELLAEDSSLQFALQQYQTANSRYSELKLPAQLYYSLIQACAQHSRLTEMALIFSDMKSRKLDSHGALFIPMIRAFAQSKDLKAANKCYEEYRALAVANAAGDLTLIDRQDMMVYAALIKAFLATDNAAGGFRFFNRILHSYETATQPNILKTAMENVYCTTFVDHAVERREFARALDFVQSQNLDQSPKDGLYGQICTAAADADNVSSAESALQAITPQTTEHVNALSATLAANLRLGRTDEARLLWVTVAASPELPKFALELTTMYAGALLNDGHIEEAFSQARTMFGRVRNSTQDQATRANIVELIDESVVLFGDVLMTKNAIVSAQGNIYLIRLMLENGGLVSPVAEHAIASIGPECVHQLNFQDIALALHVQAGMLAQSSGVSDPAHAPRFAHLLETVLNRGIPMDPSTVHAVTECISKLSNTRPDLCQRWEDFLQPARPVEPISSPFVPPSPVAPAFDVQPQHDAFDPYSHNTDFRASSIIAEQLESTTGRLENHLSDALSRFRNVRRAGRHPRYTTYAKLITAAGKTGQVHLVHEIFGMARHDVPLDLRYAAVKAGWIPILDAMVAACLTVGDRSLAAKYHQEMLEMGAAPSANTFGLYITTLKESTKTFDEATEAVKIFQRAISEGVEPGVFLYNAVIGKLGKARRIDDCLFYFGDMQSRNIRPTSVTYGTLVNALCRTSEERFAEEMFDEMESMPNYRPRAAPYNSIIQFFLNTKRDRSKALTYFERMKAKNIKPTSHTFKLLIEAHASLEPVDLKAAEAILADIKAAGMEPEAVHYGSLIHAKGCVLHDIAGARALFDSVLSNRSIRPTDNLYQNLFEAMVANHQVANTTEVLKDMARRNVQMTPYIANTLIHGWAAEGHIKEAKSIYDSLGYTKREPSTYEAMTRAFLASEDHQSASAVVQEMLSKGYPSAVTEKVLVLVGGANA
jgi:pentatricopeptide repeat protein